jgi:hypothetical protein
VTCDSRNAKDAPSSAESVLGIETNPTSCFVLKTLLHLLMEQTEIAVEDVGEGRHQSLETRQSLRLLSQHRKWN